MIHSSKSQRVAKFFVIAVSVIVLSGCSAVHYGVDSHPYQSGVKTTAPASAPAGTSGSPTESGNAPAGTLPSSNVHGSVTDDMNLQPGQCHVVVKDAAAGLVLPDSRCTPGAIDPTVTQANIASTICRSGYTSTVRPPAGQTNTLKRRDLAAYGLAYSRTIEEDHLISLELGGAAGAQENLWPEPNRSGATGTINPKDLVENRLHSAVCSGRVSLHDAQVAIATDWTTATQKFGL